MKLEVGGGEGEMCSGTGEHSEFSKTGEAKPGHGSGGCLLVRLLQTEATEPNAKEKRHYPRCHFLYFTVSARVELPF